MLFASRPTCIKRLLIIEDDPLTAFDNEHTLKHGGYQVVATVDSGEAAVAVMAAEPVDALCGLPRQASAISLASALVAALKALETMICKNEAPRKVSGLTTFWRPEAA